MKYLLSLFILVMITSCTKLGKNVTLKGRVMNPITGEKNSFFTKRGY
jgi:hypothetical protein